MGIDGNFKQLSPYVLEKLKEEPALVRVFTDARWISEIDVLRGRGLFLYKKEFEKIKADIPLVIAEGKNEYLDIDKYWHGIHFLLTKDSSSWESCKLPFLVINYSEWDNLPLVNAVMGGTAIEGHDRDFAPVRYLTHNEVKQIVEALPKIREEGFRERFNQAVMLNPDVYSTLWWEEGIFEDFQDIKNEITEYYQDAATKGNAMLIWLG